MLCITQSVGVGVPLHCMHSIVGVDRAYVLAATPFAGVRHTRTALKLKRFCLRRRVYTMGKHPKLYTKEVEAILPQACVDFAFQSQRPRSIRIH